MRHSNAKQLVRSLTAAALVAAFAIPQSLVAQTPEHLVSPSELQKAAVDASQKQQQNLDTLKKFFSSEKAQQALTSAHMNPQKVETAVASLSDAELAQLASRATKAQNELAAGSFSNRDLLIVVVAIAALVLVIVAVR
jgi:hypothetical protein